MERVRLNKALNKEVKYYGLSLNGIMGAALVGCLVWARFGMTIGIMGFVVGYGISAHVAGRWHSGELQRFIYWNLPLKGLFGGKYLPESHKRDLL